MVDDRKDPLFWSPWDACVHCLRALVCVCVCVLECVRCESSVALSKSSDFGFFCVYIPYLLCLKIMKYLVKFDCKARYTVHLANSD